MKKLLLTLLLCAAAVFGFASAASALEIDADAAVLMDAVSGRVLYQSNAHEKLAPASTTKVFTALLVLENVDDLDATVTLPDDFQNVGESGINMEPGDTYSIKDLLYALLLQSANDSAQALAIAVSGSEEAFMELMNKRNVELGLEDSHWANPHGLDDDAHYTSAHDLAVVTREALKYPVFNEIIVTPSYTLALSNSAYDTREIYNHNQFLDLYEGADGVKTGYTTNAGNCLVASATREGMRLIGVVLDAPEQSHYVQMEALMDYGFANYKPKLIASAGDVVGRVKIAHGVVSKANLVLGQDVIIAEPNNSDFEVGRGKLSVPSSIEAPCDNTDPVGTITYTDDMNDVIEVPVFLDKSVARFTYKDALRSVWQSLMNALF
ncbi:MAG: D-alanyl-D-alanine carboxypeptidase [Firmicutes bacterium]|nr:D-alanyl-D-alanine carboxypeptidase [Bacillota bacterium]